MIFSFSSTRRFTFSTGGKKKIKIISQTDATMDISFDIGQYFITKSEKNVTIHEKRKHTLKLFMCKPPTKDRKQKNMSKNTIHSTVMPIHMATVRHVTI